MKSELERLLSEALRSLVPATLSEAPDASQVVVERARDPQHGDFASTIAMRTVAVRAARTVASEGIAGEQRSKGNRAGREGVFHSCLL